MSDITIHYKTAKPNYLDRLKSFISSIFPRLGSQYPGANISHLSHHMLKDMGVEPHQRPTGPEAQGVPGRSEGHCRRSCRCRAR